MDRASKNVPVYVISEDGYDGAIAVMVLQMLGLKGARSLEGGLEAWPAGAAQP